MKFTITFSSLDQEEISKARELLDRIYAPPATVFQSVAPPPSAVVAPPPSAVVAPPPSAVVAPAPTPTRSRRQAPPRPEALATAAGNGAVDIDGLEWDPKLHSSSKAKTQDGRWRRKRGLSQVAEVSSVPAPPSVPLVLVAPPGGAEVSWDLVAKAFEVRIGKYDVAQIHNVLHEAGINPVNLYGDTAKYAQAVAVLDSRCPV